MIDFIRPYYNQAKEIARHFAPYNPEDIHLLVEHNEFLSEIEQDSQTSSPSSALDTESADKIELVEIEEEIVNSQFTLVGSSRANLTSKSNETTSAPEPIINETHSASLIGNDQTIESSETNLKVAQEVQIEPEIGQNNPNENWADNMTRIIEDNILEECHPSENTSHHKDQEEEKLELSSQIESFSDSAAQNDTINRKAIWADNIAKIMDEYLTQDESAVTEEGFDLKPETENLSNAESQEPLYNTPETEYLDFDEVSRQIYDLDPQFDQSEAFYAEQCTAYWDARGWLPAIEANRCDEEILDSIEYHRRVLLDRVKTRLETVRRDRINLELLHKASSFLQIEETCRQIAEEVNNPKNITPEESIFIRLPKNVIGFGYNIMKSITFKSALVATYLWTVSGDTLSCYNTLGTEMSNIIFGEECSIIEYGKSLSKLTPKDLVIAQLQMQKQILSETLDIMKSIVGAWWNLRVRIYKLCYSTGSKLISSSLSALSQSTSLASRLSRITSILSGLF